MIKCFNDNTCHFISDLPCSDMFKSQIFCVLRLLRCVVCIVFLICRLYAVSGGGLFLSFEVNRQWCDYLSDSWSGIISLSKGQSFRSLSPTKPLVMLLSVHQRPEKHICGGFSFSLSLRFIFAFQHSLCVSDLQMNDRNKLACAAW